jgi:prophage antirepressor-like protein
MTNNIQIFENEQLGKIRVIHIDGQPWWVLKDVCAVLGIRNHKMTAQRLDGDEVSLTDLTDNLGRLQKTAIITESGLYAVILRSDKPNAKDFRKWILCS